MVESGVEQEQGDLFLPPGFRFHPMNEEVITSYLLQKLLNPSFAPRAMGEVNLNKCEPWDLPSKAKMGEKEWYFFCHKDMKYPTGTRTNRATKEGYWKATGKDREIFKPTGGGRELIGMKKTLVFYMGRAPRGSKTNWVMHEFRLEGMSRHNANLRLSPKDEWFVCKVFHKNNNGEDKKAAAAVEHSTGTPNVSWISGDATGGDDDSLDNFLDSIIHPMYFNSTSSLPDTTAAMMAPYNAADLATSSAVGSFLDLPNYGFNDTSGNLHQPAVVNSAVPIPTSSSYSSSWTNLLHPTTVSYDLRDQMARGLNSPNFAAGLPSSSVPGISQQNSSGRGSYATTNYLTTSAAGSTATATVIGQAAAKNLGA